MMEQLSAQFHHPKGWLGYLVGKYMAIGNRERVIWAVEQLNVKATDTVLEIGFGPGLGIQALAQKAKQGSVKGIDISELMLSEASKLNADAIRRGQVFLKQGIAEDIPFDENQFDKVLTINVYHHWDDTALGLTECLRVLEENGMVAIYEQPPFGVKEQSTIIKRAEQIKAELEQAGFRQVQYITEQLGKAWVAFVTGQK